MPPKTIYKKSWYVSLGGADSVKEINLIKDVARRGSAFEIPKYFDVIKVFARGYPRLEVEAKLVREGLFNSHRKIIWSERSFSWSGPVPGTGNQLDIGFGVYEENMPKLLPRY